MIRNYERKFWIWISLYLGPIISEKNVLLLLYCNFRASFDCALLGIVCWMCHWYFSNRFQDMNFRFLSLFTNKILSPKNQNWLFISTSPCSCVWSDFKFFRRNKIKGFVSHQLKYILRRRICFCFRGNS